MERCLSSLFTSCEVIQFSRLDSWVGKLLTLMGTETELSKEIRDTLGKMGVWCIRIASGTINVGKRWIRMSEPGTPDISLPGLGAWLEVKTKTGKVSDVQKAWHARAVKENVRVAVVRSVHEAVEAVTGWKKELETVTD